MPKPANCRSEIDADSICQMDGFSLTGVSPQKMFVMIWGRNEDARSHESWNMGLANNKQKQEVSRKMVNESGSEWRRVTENSKRVRNEVLWTEWWIIMGLCRWGAMLRIWAVSREMFERYTKTTALRTLVRVCHTDTRSLGKEISNSSKDWKLEIGN